jgi:hypothetical protein
MHTRLLITPIHKPARGPVHANASTREVRMRHKLSLHTACSAALPLSGCMHVSLPWLSFRTSSPALGCQLLEGASAKVLIRGHFQKLLRQDENSANAQMLLGFQ